MSWCFLMTRMLVETCRLWARRCSELLGGLVPGRSFELFSWLATSPGLFSPELYLPFVLLCAGQLSFQCWKNVPHLLWGINQLLRTRGKTHCISHGAESPGKLEFRKDTRMWSESQHNLKHFFLTLRAFYGRLLSGWLSVARGYWISQQTTVAVQLTAGGGQY